MHEVWITGAGGLIGSHLASLAPSMAPGLSVRALTHGELDLTDSSAVREEFKRARPRLVFHCAALSRSADCRVNPLLARKINVDATATLAEMAADVQFIFFSTDLVFDGRTGNYDESASVNPLGVYAENKVAAEQLVLANPHHTVLRTSLNAGKSPSGGRAFNEEMRLAWKAGKILRLFTDEFRSPIPAAATARAAWELALGGHQGLFHVAGRERLSRWQIGQLLAARWPELQPRFEAASLSEYHGAPRAPDTSLNCAKASALVSCPLPRFSEWVSSAGAEI